MLFFDLDIVEMYLDAFKYGVRIDQVLIVDHAIFDVGHRTREFVDEHVRYNIVRNFNSDFVKAADGYLGAGYESLYVARIKNKILEIVKHASLVQGIGGGKEFSDGLPDKFGIAFVVRSDDVCMDGRVQFGSDNGSQVDVVGLGKVGIVIKKRILNALNV